jgi:hypothetical protein
MTTAQTNTYIANLALKALGSGRIDDITGSDTVSTSCRDVLDVAVQHVVNNVVIPAITTRQALVMAGTAVDGYLYAYNFPTSPAMLRPVRLASGCDYYREASTLHTNDPDAVLVYVRSNYDVADLPYYTLLAIGMKLAELLAEDLGKDERLPAVEMKLKNAMDDCKSTEGRYLNPPVSPTLWGRAR